MKRKEIRNAARKRAARVELDVASSSRGAPASQVGRRRWASHSATPFACLSRAGTRGGKYEEGNGKKGSGRERR